MGSNRRAVFYPDYRTVAVSEQSRDQCFQVDHIFAEEVDNAGVFTTCVTPLVGSFLQGANSTVFAYGITGAGKSFTMLGSEEQSGLIQLTLEHLLAAVGSLADSKLRMSYI